MLIKNYNTTVDKDYCEINFFNYMRILDSEHSDGSYLVLLQLCLLFIFLCIHFRPERILQSLHAYFLSVENFI